MSAVAKRDGGGTLVTAMSPTEFLATAEGRTVPFRPAELAVRWGCSRAHIYHLIERGELKSFRAGTLIRIPAGEVARIEAGTKTSAAGTIASTPSGKVASQSGNPLDPVISPFPEENTRPHQK